MSVNEYSEVSAYIQEHINLVKNPKSGKITAGSVGYIMRYDAIAECSGDVTIRD